MFYILIFFGIVILDQLTKTIVDANNIRFEVVNDLFSIHNVRNEGAAFSFLHDKEWGQAFLLTVSVIVLISACLHLVLTKRKSKFYLTSIVMILGGAIGNFIDRVAFGGVRDFIYVHFFANFNVADIFVCLGATLLAIFFMFFDEQPIFSKRKNADTDEQEHKNEQPDKELSNE